jgi:hypothetical protein
MSIQYETGGNLLVVNTLKTDASADKLVLFHCVLWFELLKLFG